MEHSAVVLGEPIDKRIEKWRKKVESLMPMRSRKIANQGELKEFLAGSSRSGLQDRSSKLLNRDSPENAQTVPEYPSDSLIYSRARHRMK